MTERERELRSILIQVLAGLGVSKVRIMTCLAIIVAHQIQEEMVAWIATFYGKEDTMTAQAFMSKLDELTNSEQ
jgi:hypothetical protein